MKGIRINGKSYTGLGGLKKQLDGELSLFLEEWYNDRPYVIGHTSGSTGRPKEIRLLKADMRASAAITNRFFNIGRDSVLLLCLSVSYIAGKMMVVRALESGAELLALKVSSHPLRTEKDIGRKKIDLAAMVPMQVEASVESEEEMALFCRIRHLIIGGAPVSAVLEERLKQLPVSCYATYGMTETVSHIALRKLNCDSDYFALGGVSFELDGRGCLIINAPHLRALRFVTNDLVKLNGKDRFEWLGRVDHVINSGGIKFSPEQIEQKLVRHIPGRFFITSRQDEHLGEAMVLVLEGDDWQPEDIKRILYRIRPLLDRFEMPKTLGICPSFRETASGKVIRSLPGHTVFYPVNEF